MPGHGDRHEMVEEHAPAARVVEDRGLLDLPRDGREVGGQHPHREGQRDSRVDEDHRPVGVEKPEIEHHAERRQEENHGREHLRRDDRMQEDLAAGEAEARERIAGGDRDEAVEDHRPDGDDQAVLEVDGERDRRPEIDEIPENRVGRKPHRRVVRESRLRFQRRRDHLDERVQDDHQHQPEERRGGQARQPGTGPVVGVVHRSTFRHIRRVCKTAKARRMRKIRMATAAAEPTL